MKGILTACALERLHVISLHPIADQRANILDAPGSDARTQFYGCGIAACPDAQPPGRLANGDWTAWGEDVGKAKEAGFGQRFRHRMTPSNA